MVVVKTIGFLEKKLLEPGKQDSFCSSHRSSLLEVGMYICRENRHPPLFIADGEPLS
jgi:hypothetical protein